MPLDLFHHDRLRRYQRSESLDHRFKHTFGGDYRQFGLRLSNLAGPLHLLYLLDQDDPAVPKLFPQLQFLPLLYGFRYAAFEGEMVYSVTERGEVELLKPVEPEYSQDFPYAGHPDTFPIAPIAFRQLPYNPELAEEALELQGIFGIEHLSPNELERAIQLGLSNNSYVSYSPTEAAELGWSDEDVLRILGRSPFAQGTPLKSCSNPRCTAEVAYHVPAVEAELPAETAKLLGQATMKIGGHDVRIDTMRVFAIHQPEQNESYIWGDPYVQLVFEYCDYCHCIRVSNQCT